MYFTLIKYKSQLSARCLNVELVNWKQTFLMVHKTRNHNKCQQTPSPSFVTNSLASCRKTFKNVWEYLHTWICLLINSPTSSVRSFSSWFFCWTAKWAWKFHKQKAVLSRPKTFSFALCYQTDHKNFLFFFCWLWAVRDVERRKNLPYI